ncbi:hypothetical protein EYF80_020573 [Liparis tanakae]|uniref:Uncharacterized protein n=1 Tax=Liparis tanakae TaxID=230148 RepID=A0A4Z2HTT3_9TELE|nr:hypothetical protein EYF80_020573 [Liparis tanakae]
MSPDVHSGAGLTSTTVLFLGHWVQQKDAQARSLYYTTVVQEEKAESDCVGMAFKVPDLIAEGSCEVFAALINETLHEKSGSALTGPPAASEASVQQSLTIGRKMICAHLGHSDGEAEDDDERRRRQRCGTLTAASHFKKKSDRPINPEAPEGSIPTCGLQALLSALFDQLFHLLHEAQAELILPRQGDTLHRHGQTLASGDSLTQTQHAVSQQAANHQHHSRLPPSTEQRWNYDALIVPQLLLILCRHSGNGNDAGGEDEALRGERNFSDAD